MKPATIAIVIRILRIKVFEAEWKMLVRKLIGTCSAWKIPKDLGCGPWGLPDF